MSLIYSLLFLSQTKELTIGGVHVWPAISVSLKLSKSMDEASQGLLKLDKRITCAALLH